MTTKGIGFHFRGTIGGIAIGIFTAIALFSTPELSEGTWWDVVTDGFAWAAMVVGIGLRFWSTLFLAGRKETAVVSDGPYSICRNPLYLGSFFIAISAGLFLESVTFTIGVGLSIIFYMLATVPAEERYLKSVLGKEYEDYLKRVPSFIPNFSLYREPKKLEVDLIGLKNEALRAGRWIWLPIFTEAIAMLRLEPWWPHFFRLP